MAGKVLFRADASREIGFGHVMRCLTLADALSERGGRCEFVCRALPEALAAALTSRGHVLWHLPEAVANGRAAPGFQQDDARETLDIVGSTRYDWLAVDHYGLDAAWETQVRSVAARILSVDDLSGRRHDCDLFLDQNLPGDLAAGHDERVPKPCRRLLGPRYALLRKEFGRCRTQVRPRSGPVRRILVAFGGSDAHDYTSLALDALQRLDQAEIGVDVVIGAEHPNRLHIESACRGRWAVHVQSARMAQLMAAADLAIAAGGSSTWERCCLGVPSLVAAVADNQVRVVRDAARAGLVYAIEASHLTAQSLAGQLRFVVDDQALRESMSAAGMALVDAGGAGRVARSMGFFLVTVRRAVAADAENLFAWRNHPDIRKVSHSAMPLVWAEHLHWLENVLADPSCALLIAEAAGKPAGVVRFDTTNSIARISIYAVPERDPAIRGGEVLAAAELWLRQNRPEVTEFCAEVRGENVASQRMFAAAGFTRESSVYRKRVT